MNTKLNNMYMHYDVTNASRPPSTSIENLEPEVESRTQGSRPRPRPRTQKKSEAKAKAKDSLSEDRHSRGQGQECSRPRPRTKDTGASVLQKKEGLQKFFSGDLQFIGVPRIFDWGKPST